MRAARHLCKPDFGKARDKGAIFAAFSNFKAICLIFSGNSFLHLRMVLSSAEHSNSWGGAMEFSSFASSSRKTSSISGAA
jgi:hypothetical protein